MEALERVDATTLNEARPVSRYASDLFPDVVLQTLPWTADPKSHAYPLSDSRNERSALFFRSSRKTASSM